MNRFAQNRVGAGGRARPWARQLSVAIGLVALLCSCPRPAFAVDRVWTGATSTAWGTGTNWTGGLPGGADNAVFNSTFTNQPNLGSILTVGGVWMTGSIGQNVTVSGTGLTLNGNTINGTAGLGILIDNANAFTLTMTAPVTLANAQTWRNNSGNLFTVGAGGVNLNGKAFTIDGTGNTTVTGVMSGAGAFTKAGTGTLTLSGTNTYTGTTAVSVGVLNIQNAAALGGTASGTTVTSGAALQIQGSIAVGAEALTLNGTGISNTGALRNISGTNSWSGAATLGSASTITSDAGTLTLSGSIANGGFLSTFSGAGDISVTGGISGTGGLTKNGAGTLTITGTNSYTGNVTINGGTLIAGGTSTTFALGDPTAAGRTVTVNNSGTVLSFTTNNVFGVGNANVPAIALNAGTTLTSTRYNVLGPLTLNGATLTQAAISGAGYEGYQFLGNITVGGSAASTIATTNGMGNHLSTNTVFTVADASGDSSADLIVSAPLVNQSPDYGAAAGALTKAGLGTMVLSGANTYTGATTVSAGILNIQNAAALGGTASGTTVSSGATLQMQGSITVGAETLNIAGTGATGQTGALVNVSGTNNYGGLLTLAGATTLSSDSGTLNLTNAGTITGATFGLTLAGAGNGTVSSIIGTTSGTLTKTGAGTWTLSGANTYTGATNVTAGILNIQNAGALGTSANTASTTVANGAALQITNNITTTNAGTLILNGTGGGAGALQNVSGNNAWDSNVTIASNATIVSSTAANQLTIGNVSVTSLFTMGSNTVTFSGAGDTWLNSNVGVAGDTGSVIKNGTGRLIFYGNDTNYTGATTVNAGSLELAVGPFSAGQYAINGALTIGTGPSNPALAGTVNVNIWNASYDNQLSTSSVVTINSDGALNLGTAPLTGGAGVTGSTGLGSLILNGGQVTMISTLSLTPTGSITANTNSAHQTALISGGTLNIGAPTTFTVARDATITSDLTVSSIVAGGSLTKQGAGVMTLTGANTFTGNTTVSGGTLAANADGALGATAKVTINTGGTVLLGTTAGNNRIGNTTEVALAGGTLNSGGFSETAGKMTLSANSTLDLGAGASLLTFDGISSLGTSTLSVLNWTGTQGSGGGTDQLLFSNSSFTAGSSTYQIQFNVGGTFYVGQFVNAGAGTLEAIAGITPVPEPGTIFGAGALLLGIAWRERSRIALRLRKA